MTTSPGAASTTPWMRGETRGLGERLRERYGPRGSFLDAVALGGKVDCIQDLRASRPLEDVARRPGTDHLDRARPLLIGGERDHPGPGMRLQDLPAGSRASSEGHPDVEERHVGVLAATE